MKPLPRGKTAENDHLLRSSLIPDKTQLPNGSYSFIARSFLHVNNQQIPGCFVGDLYSPELLGVECALLINDWVFCYEWTDNSEERASLTAFYHRAHYTFLKLPDNLIERDPRRPIAKETLVDFVLLEIFPRLGIVVVPGEKSAKKYPPLEKILLYQLCKKESID
jgi:hypothetical protein